MITSRFVCLGPAVLVLLFGATATPVAAQSVDLAGVRAQGMAGAFTAVADDASATWWNPAGLAGGAFVNAILEWNRTDNPHAGGSDGETNVGALSAAFPALGLSYYRFRISEMQRSTPTEAGSPSRQNGGPAGLGVSTLAAGQLGVTVGQSIGEHLVIATTLKWLRGGEPDRDSTNAATLDIGGMATFGRVRFGATVRNATSPTLGAVDAFTLDRQARIGAAVTLGSATPVTVAADADLTTTPLVSGDERQIAGGLEAWLLGRRIGLRGGVSANTVGTARPMASGGASIAVRSGIYLDGSVRGGADGARRGWSAGLRVTF